MNKLFVSVIVPAYNDSARLKKCLQALEKQTYDHDSYEVIVVDNNSTDDTATTIKLFKNVQYVYEAKPGSYAARNKALAIAKGDVYAFTDSDCLPSSQWIEEGVSILKSQQADLAGGKVSFTFSDKRSAAEIYDAKTNIQIEEAVSRKVCKTANLFVSKAVFDSIGNFPEHVKSGGDIFWTKKATNAGFKLVYAANAEVFHPTRSLSQLLKKQYRVGRGQPAIWLTEGKSLGTALKITLTGLRPSLPGYIWSKFCQAEPSNIQRKFLIIWLVAWTCALTTGLGRLSFILNYSLSKKRYEAA